MPDFRHLKYLVYSDLYAYRAKVTVYALIRELALGIGFKYSFWMRICQCLHKELVYFPCYVIGRMFLRHYMIKFGIEIPYATEIGPCLSIDHFGGIVVNGDTKIGKNCRISQDVTIGLAQRGSKKGNPVIGDNVYIGPGAKIFGNIHIGNDVAIGANCVVNRDVPSHSVVVGVPGRVVSDRGSEGYVNNADYERVLGR